MSRYWRSNRNADRFENYRELSSNRDDTGKCGHPIKKGEVIGWHPRHGAQCAGCWERWKAENAEAQAIEDGYLPQCL